MNRQKKRLVIAFVMAALFPLVYYYFSPYLVIMGATDGIIAGDLLAFAGLFLTSLFVGPGVVGLVQLVQFRSFVPKQIAEATTGKNVT